MNFRTSLIWLTGAVIALSQMATVPDAMAGPTNKYFCSVYQGIPRTFVRTPRGNAIMINWVNTIGDKTPLERCQEVSSRFQRYYDNRVLRQIATGTVNDQGVLCAVPDTKTRCTRNNLLITLPPGMDRHQAAQQLLNVRAWASGAGTVNLSNTGKEKLETYDESSGESYYNLDVIEQVAPIENEVGNPK